MAPSDTGKRPEMEEDHESGDSTDVFSSDDQDATQTKSRRTDSQRKRLIFSKDSSILHIGEGTGCAGNGNFKSDIGSGTPVDTKRKRRYMPKIFIYLADIVDAFFIGNLVVISLWSMICAWLSIRLQQKAEEDPTSTAADWVVWLEGARNPLNLIGTMFIFSLAFRFNQCYSRWWEGRKIWSDMMQTCIHINILSRIGITDEGYADRMSRYAAAFPYVCKALLRGRSVSDPEESGQDLVLRGLLSQEELDDFAEHPCWEPYYVIDLINSVLSVAYHPSKKGACGYEKEHMKMILKIIYKLSEELGAVMCVRSAGMPTSYDHIHYAFFYVYFLLAPIVWSITAGWALPIFVPFTSSVIMALMLMGSKLVDPFGTDVVDLPLDSFCEAVEIQIREVDARRKRKRMNEFVEKSTTDNLSAENDVLLPSKMKSSLGLLQEHKTNRKDLLRKSSSAMLMTSESKK